jgi:hypothetical protein
MRNKADDIPTSEIQCLKIPYYVWWSEAFDDDYLFILKNLVWLKILCWW